MEIRKCLTTDIARTLENVMIMALAIMAKIAIIVNGHFGDNDHDSQYGCLKNCRDFRKAVLHFKVI